MYDGPMDTTNATIAYSTTTAEKPVLGEISTDLLYELGLQEASEPDFDPSWAESDLYDEWCFVCSRPTDHRGEHDDLVAQGLASYDPKLPMVYSER